MNHILKYQIDLKDGSFSRVMGQAQQQTRTLDNLVRRAALAFGGMFAADRLIQFGKESVHTSAKFQTLDNVIKFGSKNTQEYAKNTIFLRDIIGRLNIPIRETTEGFSELSGAFKGTKMEGENARQVFKGVAEAAAALHMDPQKVSQVMRALSQIQSKGKLMAQELHLQLGDAIPGAMKLAADAMGLSTAELNKQMEKGLISSETFLTAFGSHLQQVFGGQAILAAQSFQNQMTRNESSITRLSASMGEKLQPAYLSLQSIQVRALETANNLFGLYLRNKDAINAVAKSVSMVTFAWATYTGVVKLADLAQNRLNLSMKANPAFWVVTGISLLTYAYSKLHKKTEDVSKTQRDQIGIIAKDKVEMSASIEVLKKINTKNSERSSIIDEINSKYGQYLPKLLTEKTTLAELNKLQVAGQKAIEEKLLTQEKEMELTPIYTKMIEAQKLQAQLNVEKAKLAGGLIPTGPETDAALSFLQKKILNLNPISLGMEYEAVKRKYDGLAKSLGVKIGVDHTSDYSSSNSQSVSSTKSIRNVTVNLESLVKEMKNYFNGPNDNNTAQNVKQELVRLLTGVVLDSELALD